jgi:hypothetical protein
LLELTLDLGITNQELPIRSQSGIMGYMTGHFISIGKTATMKIRLQRNSVWAEEKYEAERMERSAALRQAQRDASTGSVRRTFETWGLQMQEWREAKWEKKQMRPDTKSVL